MVSILPKTPAPPQQRIERFGQPNREPLNAARKVFRAIRLDQKVEMIGLNRKLHDSEAIPLADSVRIAENTRWMHNATRGRLIEGRPLITRKVTCTG